MFFLTFLVLFLFCIVSCCIKTWLAYFKENDKIESPMKTTKKTLKEQPEPNLCLESSILLGTCYTNKLIGFILAMSNLPIERKRKLM